VISSAAKASRHPITSTAPRSPYTENVYSSSVSHPSAFSSATV
jgi:hypothetical protein